MIHTSIITCFKPDPDCLISLCKNLLNQNSRILLIDNSHAPIRLDDLNLRHNLVSHIKLKKNMGIAYAQNIGIKEAVKNKSEFITFFDQDSVIEDNFIKNILQDIESKTDGIITPFAVDIVNNDPLPSIKLNKLGLPYVFKSHQLQDIFSIDIAISSGTTISSQIIDKVGFFNEALFIDHVDTEWCLRCRHMGLQIFQTPKAVMKHNIGNNRKKFGPITIQIHPPERCYYQMRNSLSLLKFKHIPKALAIYDILSTLFNRLFLLFISDCKKDYFIALCKGIKDGLFINVEPKSY